MTISMSYIVASDCAN